MNRGDPVADHDRDKHAVAGAGDKAEMLILSHIEQTDDSTGNRQRESKNVTGIINDGKTGNHKEQGKTFEQGGSGYSTLRGCGLLRLLGAACGRRMRRCALFSLFTVVFGYCPTGYLPTY